MDAFACFCWHWFVIGCLFWLTLLCAEFSHPTGALSTIRSQSPASSISRRVFPHGCGESPRERIRLPVLMGLSLHARLRVLARLSLVPAYAFLLSWDVRNSHSDQPKKWRLERSSQREFIPEVICKQPSEE